MGDSWKNDAADGPTGGKRSLRTTDTFFTKKPRLDEENNFITITINMGDNKFAAVPSISSVTLKVNEERCTETVNINETVSAIPEANKTVSVMPEVNETVSTMPEVNETVSAMPEVNEIVSAMPEVNETVSVMPEVNETASTMPEVNENRERLRPIVETIIFCGRQNISLHDHDGNNKLLDDGGIHSLVSVEGNLSALMKFRKQSCNTTLHNLKNTKSIAIDKFELNELINVCEEIIQENIFHNVKKAKCFSILFNETTDITSQLYLSARYIHNGIIKEDFVCVCDTLRSYQLDNNTNTTEQRLTAEALAKIVVNICLKFDIDLTWCEGIGADSVAMASKIKDAVQFLSNKYIHAKCYPCSNQVLNSSLATSCKVISCRNASTTMRKVIAFVNTSDQMREIFKKELAILRAILHGIRIREMCLVDSYDEHRLFQGDNLVKICCVLEKISTWQDNKIAYEAYCLLQLLRSPDFIVSSICLRDILGTTVTLSKLLERSSIALLKTWDTIFDTLNVLRRKEEEADTDFRKLFEGAKEVAQQLRVEIKCPTNVRREKAQSAEEYFRTDVYIPLLDYVINNIKERLYPEVIKIITLGIFVPNVNYTYTKKDIERVMEISTSYTRLMGKTTLDTKNRTEFQRWLDNLQCSINKTPSIYTLIENCDTEIFTNVKRYLRTIATLPVSLATAESSVPLRRLKTWLKASNAEDRLIGLALLYVHKDIPIQVDEVITRFVRRRYIKKN